MNSFRLLMIIFTLIALPQRVAYAQKPIMSVAIDHAPPFTFIDDKGRPKGLIIDVMESLRSQLPYDFEYIQCPWARCLKLVESGAVDLLPGATRTQSREQAFIYIDPPFIDRNEVNQFRFYTNKRHLAINTYTDLYPLNIGTLRGSTYNEQFENDNTITKTAFVDIQSMFDALEKNRIDAFIYYDDTVVPLLKEFDPLNKISASKLGLPTKQYAYLVMSKKSKHLPQVETISEQLKALIDEGKIKQLFKRYGL